MKIPRVLPLLALLFSLAFAQTGPVGPYVTRTYDLRELTSRPAMVLVSPNYLTVLDFEDSVEEVASGRPELMNLEVRENLILLRANKNAGATDLVVKVAGRVALFRVKVDTTSYNPRRYLIRFPEPAGTLGTSNGSGYAIPGEPKPVQPAPKVPNNPYTEKPSNPGDKATSMEAPTVSEEPGWLPLTLSAYTTSGGNLHLTLVAENQGKNPVVFEGVRLKLYTLNGEEQVPLRYQFVQATSGAYPGRVYNGQSYSSLILVREAPQGEIWLEWTLTEIGPGKTYTLRRKIHAGAVLEPQPPAR